MKTSYFFRLGLTFGTLLLSSYLSAQPCLTAKPAPACRSCFITEFGYNFGITSPLREVNIHTVENSTTSSFERELTGRHYLTSELGYIYNITPKYGLGLTNFSGWNLGHSVRGGIKLRIRRWFNQKTSLDFSGGVSLWGRRFELDHPAFIGGVSLNSGEWMGVNMLVEILATELHEHSFFDGEGRLHRDFSPRRSNVAVYLGYQLNSKPGLIANGVVAVTGGVVLAIVLTAFIVNSQGD